MSKSRITVIGTRPVAAYTVATLNDGREIAARTTSARWAGTMIEVRFLDVTNAKWGEFVTTRQGTSHRLAIAEAVDKLNNPPKPVRALRPVVIVKEEAPTHPVKQLVSGEGFLWLGSSHRLRVVDEGGPIAFHEPWRHQCWLHLRRDSASADTIIGWYQTQGAAYAAEVVERWAPLLNVRDVKVNVRSLAKKWGHARRNTITLHWATFQLPRALVELIIVHELAHIADTNGKSAHGPAWRRIMDRVLLDWREQERELAKREVEVWLGDVQSDAA